MKYIIWLYIIGVIILLVIILLVITGIVPFTLKEGFQTASGSSTIAPLLIADKSSNASSQQEGNGNLIAINNSIALNSPLNLNTSTGNLTFPYKTELQLQDTYVFTQLQFKMLTTSANSIKIRIGIRNTAKNDLQFINFADLLVRDNKIVDTESLEYINKTTGNTATSNLYIAKPTNIYGNQLTGDRIIIYTGTPISTNCSMYCFGFLEKDNYKALVSQMAKPITNDIYVGPYSNITIQQGSRADDYLISSFQIVNKNQLPTNSACSNAQLFKVVFKNNYTNDIVTYPGPVNGFFIYEPAVSIQTIILPSTMVATKFSICSTGCGSSDNSTDITQCVTVQNIKGYTASIADINRFKLEYNITDIRGSINPDDVCPSIDKFVENQLSSELIIDAMDYQKKINDEKSKLQSNKDNLLNLLEQQDEITQLGKLISKIKDVNTTRDHQTNAVNALQLFKQMNEYTKLKEVLDDRITLRKQNTFDVAVNVNNVTEPFISIANNGLGLLPEDDYHLA
jgi:hypothetical protein